MQKFNAILDRLDAALGGAAPAASAATRAAVQRWRADAAAMRFHLTDVKGPQLIAVVGGTGTGKSTLVNRLLGANLTASSFRRTFTAGPVALAAVAATLPDHWLGPEFDRIVSQGAELPARGRSGALVIVPHDCDVTRRVTLIDTPDLDGDQPAHHALADHVFRWATALVFVVTPEKYQMTELLPYYRLARRYATPALYVMNKCEESAVLEDYRRQLLAHTRPPDETGDAVEPMIFAIPRDDAAYEPPPSMTLSGLRQAITSMPAPAGSAKAAGLRHRAGDLLGRLSDQVVGPMEDDRRAAGRLIAAVRSMETPAVGVDVNPLTQQLQRRLQQRSILYLMGPGRILDRVRQAPGLLVRLPRVAWDYFKTGELSPDALNPSSAAKATEPPDFGAMLADQWRLLLSRLDDVLRAAPAGERWLRDESASYAAAQLDPSQAAKIAEEELASLRTWLEQRWNAKPRDTRAVEGLLKFIPGARKLTQWSEAAPYLLAIVLATHGAIFGHVDLMVLGGYGLATWLTERVSNEVTARTRKANVQIADRFTALAHEQIERVAAWLDRQAPPAQTLANLRRLTDDAQESLSG